MNYLEKIKSEFQPILQDFNQSPVMQRIMRGDFTLEHYKSLMRQISHHTRENPQLQALATVYFRGQQRKMIQLFYKHAMSEIGHDQLALNDIAALDEDVSEIPYEQPLPDTAALLAFGFYQIYNLNPVGYLGYLFFLEFTPTQSGKSYMELLAKKGVPESAMTFLADHTTIDVGHNKLMERYVEALVTNEQEFNAVVYAIKVTAKLYANMIQGAFEQVDNPRSYGISAIESQFRPKTQAATE